MRLLRNPVVVGILALVAVIVVLYQAVGDRLFGPRGFFASKPATATATSTPAAPAAPPPQAAAAPKPPPVRAATYTNLETALLPTQGVDAPLVEQRFTSWVSAPLRDPFLLLAPGPKPTQRVPTNSPVASWKLSGIWNQSGSRLAVINRRVYGEGDEIQGYRVAKIVADEVWVMGTNGLERLGMQPHSSAGAKK